MARFDKIWLMPVKSGCDEVTSAIDVVDICTLPTADRVGIALAFRLAIGVSRHLLEAVMSGLALTPDEAAQVAAVNLEDIATAVAMIPAAPASRFAAQCLLVDAALGSRTPHGYSAMNRAKIRASARLLRVSWPVVAAVEVDTLMRLVHVESSDDLRHEVTTVPESGSSGRVRTVQDGWTVVGFTAAGAVLLTATGFLIFPMIVVTVGLVGKTVGGVAVLTHASTTAAAAAGTAAAVTSTTAVGTKVVVISTFGFGGAMLGKSKALRRTAGCSDFYFRRINSVVVPETRMVIEEQGESIMLGIVVPISTRNTAVANLLAECEQEAKIGIVIDNKIKSTFELLKEDTAFGTWQNKPVPQIPPNTSGVCVARNRGYHVAVATGTITYKIDDTHQLVVFYSRPLIGENLCGVIVVPLTVEFEKASAMAVAVAKPHDGFYFDDDYDVKWHGTGSKVVMFERAHTLTPYQSRVVMIDECQQCAEDVRSLLVHRRFAVVTVRNETLYPLTLLVVEFCAGKPSGKAPVPRSVPPGHGAVYALHNTDNTLGSASAKVFYQCGAITFGMWAHCSVGGTLWASAEAREGCPPPSTFTFDSDDKTMVMMPDGSTFLVSWEIDVERWMVHFTLQQMALVTDSIRPAAHLTVVISGFLTIYDPRYAIGEQAGLMWNVLFRDPKVLGLEGAETYYLGWDSHRQAKFGNVCRKAFSDIREHAFDIGMEAAAEAAFDAIALISFIKIPMYVVWAADAIDNSYAVLQNRAVDAGHQLAVALLGNFHGKRPVSLVAYSCGTGVILQCLKDLIASNAPDIVENVFFIGSTVPADDETWTLIRSAVSGRVVNVYSAKDWMLSFMCRTNSVSFRPAAGLCRIKNVPGVENVNVGHLVSNHIQYLKRMGRILDLIPPTPTEHTLDPDEESPGLVTPIQRGLRAKILAVHDSFRGTTQVTICLTNLLPGPMQYVRHGFTVGRWELTPPPVIEESFAGVMVAQNQTRRTSGVSGWVADRCGDVFVVCWFTRMDATLGAAPSIVCCLLDGDVPLPDVLTVPPADTLAYTTAWGLRYLLTVDARSCCTLELSLPDDRALAADMETMLELDEWAAPENADTFELRPDTSKWATAESALRNHSTTLSSPSMATLTATRPNECFSHKLHIVVSNLTVGRHLNFMTDETEGTWKFVPSHSTPPGKQFLCGMVPRKVRGTMEGFVALRVVRSDDEVHECTLLLGFSQAWEEDGTATCSVQLLAPGVEIADGYAGWREGLTSECSASEDEHIAVVAEVVQGRNAIVVVVRSF